MIRTALILVTLALTGCAGSGVQQDLTAYCLGSGGGFTPAMQAVCQRLREVQQP